MVNNMQELIKLPHKQFRVYDGKKWHYDGVFLSPDGKIWYRPIGIRQMKEVKWIVKFAIGINENGETIYEK